MWGPDLHRLYIWMAGNDIWMAGNGATQAHRWGLAIPRLEAWTESTSAPGLRLEPLDELSHLRVRGLELGEPPRIGQRLSRIGLLARVGDQRSEHLAIVRMAREHAQERFHRLLRPSCPDLSHREHGS